MSVISGLLALLHPAQEGHLPAQSGDLLADASRARVGNVVAFPVRSVERHEVAGDAGIQPVPGALLPGPPCRYGPRLLTALNFDPSKATVTRAKHYEGSTDRPVCRSIVAPELGDRLKVGSQGAGQPHPLDAALRLTLKLPARRHPVEIAVAEQLQKRCQAISRPARRRGLKRGEAQGAQIAFINERLD